MPAIIKAYRQPSTRQRQGQRLARLLWLLLVISGMIAAADKHASTASELEAVRERINELEQDIEATRNESDALQEKLRQVEADIHASRTRLERLHTAIRQKKELLKSLNEQRTEYESRLGDARQALARQMRAAYKTGRSHYLRLLLNQQNPAVMGRILTYYEYYNRTRMQEIRAVSHELEQLATLAQRVEREHAELAELEQSEQARLTELQGLKNARNKIIRHLDAEIRDKSQQLATLHEDQKRLQKLLEELHRQPRAAPGQQLPEFGKLRGKLDWPVDGRLLNSFGASRRGGALTWQGIRISADNGEEVRAVSAGQVIFADWFRTLGLLIIIDHGGGYMSLYGHNNELLKTAGAWVEDGEIIARAGESGGQDRTALYFEIRHDGKPVDPALWCRR